MEGNVTALLALATASVITVLGGATLKNKQIERDTKISDQAEQISSLKDDLSQEKSDKEFFMGKCSEYERIIQNLNSTHQKDAQKIESLKSDLSQKRKQIAELNHRLKLFKGAYQSWSVKNQKLSEKLAGEHFQKN